MANRELEMEVDQLKRDLQRLSRKLTPDVARDYLGDVSDQLQEQWQQVQSKAKVAGRQADAYAHDNPWQLIGAAALTGLVIGLLMTKKD